LAKALGVPAVVKLHGSDIDVLAERPIIRRYLRTTFRHAAAVVAVSRPLAEQAEALGAKRVFTVRNGVDKSTFGPRDRHAARAELGLPQYGRILVYVGRLSQEKGCLDLIEAFREVAARVADAHLYFVGDGPDRAPCEVDALGLPISFVGQLPLGEVARWVAASDAVTLPSWHEGTPNVIIEALSSGRRVVATRVGGIPELVTSDALGELVERQSPVELARALERALSCQYDPEHVARCFVPATWAESAATLFQVLRTAASSAPHEWTGPVARRSLEEAA
jgi:glycosyltransferase involved in cell wall biosynthesis